MATRKQRWVARWLREREPGKMALLRHAVHFMRSLCGPPPSFAQSVACHRTVKFRLYSTPDVTQGYCYRRHPPSGFAPMAYHCLPAAGSWASASSFRSQVSFSLPRDDSPGPPHAPCAMPPRSERNVGWPSTLKRRLFVLLRGHGQDTWPRYMAPLTHEALGTVGAPELHMSTHVDFPMRGIRGRRLPRPDERTAPCVVDERGPPAGMKRSVETQSLARSSLPFVMPLGCHHLTGGPTVFRRIAGLLWAAFQLDRLHVYHDDI